MKDLAPRTRGLLDGAGLDADEVSSVITRAIDEDFRDGPDVTTTSCVPIDACGAAAVTPRAPGVFAGGPVALAVLDLMTDHGYELVELVEDGDVLQAGQPALRIIGRDREILTAERTLLNLLTHLSGIATLTRAWVDAVAGTGARIRDTRKTLPGLRALEKYAVRCGGGVNHRVSLGDAALVKDNHVAAAGSVTAAVAAVRAHAPESLLEVEVDSLTQLDEALAAGVALILLDNFTTADTAAAVARVRGSGADGVRLEASGGLTLDRASQVASCGVDFLAVGALTHSAPALDLGLDLTPLPADPVP